jgi:hypothetical protein
MYGQFPGRAEKLHTQHGPLLYIRPMPRGNPKRPTQLRLDPVRVTAVQALGVPLTRAIEEGLDLWLARERRKAAKGGADPLTRHLMPPTARELDARRVVSKPRETKEDAA